jgi:putative ABC transport system ATP-binding protein
MIEVRQVFKLYRMGDSVVRALDGVDFDVGEGEFVSITGASGSGKSTLMHILGCLDRPTRGVYRLRRQTLSAMGDRQLARIRNKYIGFVFQTFNLINRTHAVDNVAIPLVYARQTATRKAALAALDKVGLSHRAKHRPSELSGGERQRVAIARAIVNDPALILADEPTGNLDSRTGAQILDIFRKLHAAGTTIILVTHEIDVAVQAQRIIRMRDGRIITDEALDDARRIELRAETVAVG